MKRQEKCKERQILPGTAGLLQVNHYKTRACGIAMSVMEDYYTIKTIPEVNDKR
ncbi:MAG: hypothetical protein AB7U40_08245 [Methanobacteriales archaeon]